MEVYLAHSLGLVRVYLLVGSQDGAHGKSLRRASSTKFLSVSVFLCLIPSSYEPSRIQSWGLTLMPNFFQKALPFNTIIRLRCCSPNPIIMAHLVQHLNFGGTYSNHSNWFCFLDKESQTELVLKFENSIICTCCIACHSDV